MNTAIHASGLDLKNLSMHPQSAFAAQGVARNNRKPNLLVMLRACCSCLILAVLISGCSSLPFFGKDDADKEEDTSSEQELYERAQGALRSANYSTAIEVLQILEARFPFGRYAEQAQLEIIYAYYQAFQPEAALSAADRFIRLHPLHPNVDYAYYLKGLAAFNRDAGVFDRLFNLDQSKRDVASAQESFAYFSQLLALYPESDYAPDARQRMLHLRNLLASAEVNIARYYMKRKAYIAAANRARYVVENYSRTPSAAEALSLMTQANQLLGLDQAAQDSVRVLAYNYPEHPALNTEGTFVVDDPIRNADRSWLNLVTWGLLDRPDPSPPIRIENPDTLAAEQATGQAISQRTPADDSAEDVTADSKRRWYQRIPFVN